MKDDYLFSEQDQSYEVSHKKKSNVKFECIAIDVGFGYSVDDKYVYDAYDFYKKARITDRSIKPFVDRVLSNVNNLFLVRVAAFEGHEMRVFLVDGKNEICGLINLEMAIKKSCNQIKNEISYYRQDSALNYHPMEEIQNKISRQIESIKNMKASLESMLDFVSKTINKIDK